MISQLGFRASVVMWGVSGHSSTVGIFCLGLMFVLCTLCVVGGLAEISVIDFLAIPFCHCDYYI